MPTPADPSPARRWFHHAQTGDLGFMVERDGAPHIKLDRPGEHVRPYRAAEWIEQERPRRYTDSDVVQVAFAADRAYLRLIGRHDLAQRGWQELGEDARRRFIEQGPSGPTRGELYRRIKELLVSL